MDWYFLIQHHSALHGCSTGRTEGESALDFALRNKTKDALRDEKVKSECHPFVYVLDPDRLKDRLNTLSDRADDEERWKNYVKKHPFFEGREDEWEYAYLPADEKERDELPIPIVPLVLDFPHITRRVAAQRSV